MRGQIDMMLIAKIILALVVLFLAIYFIRAYVVAPGTGTIPGEGLLNP
jgi:hypothetical protein